MKNKLKPNKLNTPLSIIQAVLLLSIIVFCFSACEKDFAQEPIDKSQATISPDQQKEAPIVTNRADIPKAEVSDLQIADNVKILDDNMIALLVDFNDEKVVFKKDEQIKFETDDIINSMPSAIAPVGIAHRIVKVEVNDENYTYYLKPAGFDEMVLGGEVSFSSERITYAENAAKPNKTFEKDFNIETTLGHRNHPSEVKVNVAGKFIFEFDFSSRGTYTTTDDYLKCALYAEFYDNPVQPDFTATLAGKFDTPIFGRALPSTSFWVGGLYVYFQNNIEINAEFEVNQNFNLSAGFDLSGKIGNAIIRDRENITSQPINTLTTKWVNSTSLSNVVTGSAQLSVPVKLVSRFWGQKLFQFYTELAPTFILDLSSDREYLLTLNFELPISGGVEGEFRRWNYDIKAYNANLYRREIGKYFPNPAGLNNPANLWSTTGLNKPNRLTYMKSITNGKYLSDEQGGTYCRVNRAAIGDWEKFQFFYHGVDKTYSIKGSNGRYFMVENNKLKCIDHNGIGEATRFYIQHDGGGHYTIQSKVTGRYLSVVGDQAALSLYSKSWSAKWTIAEQDIAQGGGSGDFGNTSGLKIKDIFNLNGSRNLVLQSSDNSWGGNAGLNFKYLHSENGNNWATVYSPQIQDQNKFAIEYLGGDSYAIKGSNGGYADIARSDGGLIKFTHWNREDSDCRFIIYYHGIKHNKHAFSIKSEATGKYLKSNHLGQVSFSADSSADNYWLIFQQ